MALRFFNPLSATTAHAGIAVGLIVLSLTAGCGGGDSGSDTRKTYSVSLTVNGLAGTGLVVQNNGADNLAIPQDGTYAFAGKLTKKKPYKVSVLTQPIVPEQTCFVEHGEGLIDGGDIDDIHLVCHDNPQLKITAWDGEVMLTWPAIAAGQFNLCTDTQPDHAFSQCNNLTDKVSPMQLVKGLTNGVAYYFTLEALWSDGYKTYSQQTSAQPLAKLNGEVQTAGDGFEVGVASGSLSSAVINDDTARVNAVSDYLKAHKGQFGAAGVDDAAIVFARSSLHSDVVTRGNGEQYTYLTLKQSHQGATVLDAVQYAAFLHVAGNSDQLRRLHGRLYDPSKLPTPPPTDTDTLAATQALVAQLITDYNLSPDSTSFDTTPVIHAGYGYAGFHVTELNTDANGTHSIFEALVDPRQSGARQRLVIGRNTDCTETKPGNDNVESISVGNAITIGDHPITSTRFIRILAIPLADDDGSNLSPITGAEISHWVEEANKTWYPYANIFFLFNETSDMQALNKTILNQQPETPLDKLNYNSLANAVATLQFTDRLVVFFRNNGGRGFSWGPWDSQFVSMPAYTHTGILKPNDDLDGDGIIANDTLLSHELGHYFGLAHTFAETICGFSEPATSDGDRTGQLFDDPADDVADTQADLSDVCKGPGATEGGGYSPSLHCTGGKIWYAGYPWYQPWNNVMSYHDCLPENLSAQQVDAINLTLQHPLRAKHIK